MQTNHFSSLHLWLQIAIALFIATPILSQAPDISWSQTLGGSNYDWGQSVQETSDGGFIVLGETYTYATGDPGTPDLYVVRTDSAGQLLWWRTFGGASHEYASAIIETANGDFVIAGGSYSEGNTWDSDIYLVRMDGDGNVIWTRTLVGSSYDHCHAIVETDDGGFVLAGITRSFGAGNNDIYLVRTDASGNELRIATFGGPDAEYGFSIDKTTDKGFIVAGTIPVAGGYDDVWLIRTDSLLNGKWSNSYSKAPTSIDFGITVKSTADGGFTVAAKSVESGNAGMWMFHTDSTGIMEWNQSYAGGMYDGTYDRDTGNILEQTSDGGYVIVTEEDDATGKSDILVIRTDDTGTVLWQQNFGGADDEVGHSIQQTADGGFIIIGDTRSFGAGYMDVWLIRLESENPTAIADRSELPATFQLKQNYPNPFNPSTTIEFQLPRASVVSMEIFDNIGRRVVGARRAVTQPGTHQYVWNGTDAGGQPVSSGTYFYRLMVDGIVQTRMMQLLK